VTDFLRENIDQIKTIVVKTKGTPTQKLLAILEACGIEKTAELAELIGVQQRAIQKARRTEGRVPGDASELQDASLSSETNCGTHSEKKVSPRTPLQRKTTPPATVQPVAARDGGEPDGDMAECKTAFNGSTEAMVAEIERLMGGHCRKNATQWLANLLRAQGQQAVIEGYQSLLTAKAEGEIITHPLRWWDSMAKRAKANAPKAAKPSAEIIAYPLAAITADMKRNMKPAPGSARMPEVSRA
jgi:hypothetical protein